MSDSTSKVQDLFRVLEKAIELLEETIEELSEDDYVVHYEEALYLISEISDTLKMGKTLNDLVVQKGCYLVDAILEC